MSKITRSAIGPLHEKITVELTKADYLYNFEKTLKKLAKDLDLPGFRTGKAPAGLVRKIYGAEVLENLLEDLADDLLEAYLEGLQLHIFRSPLLLAAPEEFDLNNLASFRYEYEIGLHPALEISLPDKSVEITRYQLTFDQERLNEEVNDELSMQAEQEEIAQVENEEDILYLSGKPEEYANWTLEELDKEWDFPIILDLPQRLKDQAIGKRVGDILYLNPFQDIDDEEWRKSYLKGIIEVDNVEAAADQDYELYVLKVSRNVKPPLTQAVFEKRFPNCNLTTEAEFREALRQDLEEGLQSTSENYFKEALLKDLLQRNPTEMPTEFIKRALLDAAKEQGMGFRTLEQIETRYPNIAEEALEGMLLEKIADRLHLEVSEAEIRVKMIEKTKDFQHLFRINATTEEIEALADKDLKEDATRDDLTLAILKEKVLQHLQTLVTVREEEIAQEAFFKRHHPSLYKDEETLQNNSADRDVAGDGEFE